MKTKKISLLPILLIAVVLMLSLVHVLRFQDNKNLIGYDSYYHIDLVKQFKGSENITGRISHPLEYLISLTDNELLLFRLLPFLAGIANTILIYLILKDLFHENILKDFIMIFIILSPMFIYMYGTFNEHFLSVFSMLLAVFFILKEKYLLAPLCLLSAFAFNQRYFIIIILTLLLLYEKLKSRNIVVPTLGLVLSGSLLVYIGSISPQNLSLFDFMKDHISDLGAGFGIGIFCLMTSIMGIVISWKEKKKHSFNYIAILFLMIFSVFESSLIIVLDMFFAYYSGIVLLKLWNSKWKSNTLKSYVILLILCGILFSSGSMISRIAKEGPYDSEILSLNWLKPKVSENDVVFSEYEYGHLIKAISGAETYTDNIYFRFSKDKQKINISNTIFQSRDLETITRFMDRNKIRYIWINDKMKQGRVWTTPDEGMLLILQNSIHFKKRYSHLGIEIWEYIG
ncbi:hypothetical protein JXC34_07185 [Candidatus Woesearchaeota archaeon]|nr:hypothetical protein [Candidatus Woesearchaeota archaeon]